jgi:mono/diheme cytochrome c family protein
MSWRTFARIAALLIVASESHLMVASAEFPERLYMLNCWGCHRPHGEGIPGTAPPLRGAADFLRVPGGRQYLIEVPGVSQSALDDAQVAAVMNWIIQSFSSDRIPADFRAYTSDEIAKYRRTRLMDIKKTRARLVSEMVEMKIRPSIP